ncbi:hypothetical protein MIR68_003482 [Amoeboaphelidium protococcarum]|nr:hypothetical protein MIR68_003482 [Amoeboaphelidium protococcarum]
MASKFRIENSTDDDDDAGVDDYKVQSIANKYLSMAEVNKQSVIGPNNKIEGVSMSGSEDVGISGESDDDGGDQSDSLESQSSQELTAQENVQDHTNHPQQQQQVATESSQSIDVAKRDRKMQKLLKKLPKFFLSADTVDSDSDLDNAPVPDPRDNLHLSLEDSDESSLSETEADGDSEASNDKAVKKRGKSSVRRKSKKSNNDSDDDGDSDCDGNSRKKSRKQKKLSKKKIEELRLQTARLNRAALLTLEPANERITLQDMIKIVRGGGGQCEDTTQDQATTFGNANQEDFCDAEEDEEVEYSIQVPQSNTEDFKQAQLHQDQSMKKQTFDVKSLISKFSASTSVEVVADFKKIKSKSLLDGIILSSKRRHGLDREAAAHRSNQKSLSFKEKMEEARLKISLQNRSNFEVKYVNQESSTAVVQVDGDNNELAIESAVLDQVEEEQQDDEDGGDHDNSDKSEDSSFDYDIKSSKQNSNDPSPTLDILSDEYISDENDTIAKHDENPVSPANTSTNDNSAVDEGSIENQSYNQEFNLLTQGEDLQTQAPVNKNNTNGGIKGMLARMNVNVKSIALGVGDNGNFPLVDAQTESSDSEIDQVLHDPDDVPQRKKKRKIVDTDDDDDNEQDDQNVSSEDENSQDNDSHLNNAKVNTEAKFRERTEFIDEEADLEDDEFMNMGGVDGDLLDREKALAEELAGFVTNDADLLQEYADDELIDQDDRVRELHGLLERRQDLAQVKNAVKITAGQLRGKTKTAAANQQNEEVNKFGRMEDDEDECDLGLNELDQVEDYGQFGSVIEKIMARNVEQKKKRMLNKRRRLQDETVGGQQSLGSNANDAINGGSTYNAEDDEDWTNEHGADSGFVNLGIAGGELIITDLDHLEEFAKKRSILEQLDANDTGFKSSDVLSRIIDGSNSQDSLGGDQKVSSTIFKSQSTTVKSIATQYKRLFQVDDNENSMGLANSGASRKQDVSLNRLKSVVQLTEDELHQIRSGKSTSNSNFGGNNKSRITSSEYSKHPSRHGPPRKTVGFKVGLQPSEKQNSSDSHDHKGNSSTLRSALKAAGMFEK